MNSNNSNMDHEDFGMMQKQQQQQPYNTNNMHSNSISNTNINNNNNNNNQFGNEIANHTICSIHKSEFIKVCYTDCLALCQKCIPEHINHTIVEPSNYFKYMKDKCVEFEPVLQQNRDILKSLELPKSEQMFEKNINILETAKQELLNLVEEYFQDVISTYSHLCSKYPSAESKGLLLKKVDDIQEIFKQTKKKSDENRIKPLDLAQFLQQNYSQTMEQLSEEVKNLQESQQKYQQSQQQYQALKNATSKNTSQINSLHNSKQQQLNNANNFNNNSKNIENNNNQNPPVFPYFKVNKRCVEKLMFDLLNYVTPVFPGTLKEQHINQPNIQRQNTYQIQNVQHSPQQQQNQNQPHIGIPSQNCFSDSNNNNQQQQAILQYNIQTQQQQSNIAQTINKSNNQLQSKHIPYQPSFVVIPSTNSLFITGGVNPENGQILDQCSEQSMADDIKSVWKNPLQKMKIKRCGHTLLYVPCKKTGSSIHINTDSQGIIGNLNMNNISIKPKSIWNQQVEPSLNDSEEGFIYAIGGRTNDKVRTKLCEKYNISKKCWVPIQQLQSARSRAACCLVNDRYIYAFYGTNSYQKAVTSIEKYDIMKDEWSFVKVQNHLPGFDLCHSGALQINQNQILLLGGFRDSMFFEGEYLFNRKLMSFNIKTASLSLYDDSLPQDCIVQGQPIIHNNSIYVIGSTMKNIGTKQPEMNLENFTLFKINQQGSEIQCILQQQQQQQEQKQQIQSSQQQQQQQEQQQNNNINLNNNNNLNNNISTQQMRPQSQQNQKMRNSNNNFLNQSNINQNNNNTNNNSHMYVSQSVQQQSRIIQQSQANNYYQQQQQ